MLHLETTVKTNQENNVKVQSTLALWTPRYYGHSVLWTKFRSPNLYQLSETWSEA